MDVAINDIKVKSDKLITSYKEKELSEEQKINKFLDNILKIRKPIEEAVKTINELDALLLLSTWAEIKTEQDKEDIKYIMNRAKEIHYIFIKDYAYLHKNLPRKFFKEILSEFKIAVDDFEDSIFEIKNIFLKVRKNKKLISLINSLS